MIEFISQPWPWYVSGPLIALIMGILLFSGKTFGVSSNLRVLCAACGAGKKSSFFDFDWKSQRWNLLFVLGAAIGGYISVTFLNGSETPAIADATKVMLSNWNIEVGQNEIIPQQIFQWSSLSSYQGWVMLVLGGFLVGFGSRYGGGCTSGHAITGLSNLQLPSLLAVIGFFIGGLIVSFLILPNLF